MIDELQNINWENFHFLRPMFLWLLIPAFVALILGFISISKQAAWQKYIAPHLRPYVIKKGNKSRIRWIRIWAVVTVSIAIVGLAGPVWKKIQIPGKTLETPVVIILDVSQSMMATDIQPSRLERAKFKIHDFLNANPHARTALIGFAGTAHVIVPLTSDYKIIESHLGGVTPDIMPLPGSNLSAALQLCDTITKVTDAPATLILFTDDFTDETFDLLNEFVSLGSTKVEVVPMNTITGADVIRPNSKSPFKDENGKAVHSKLDKVILDKLNSLENITVNALTLDNSDMELLAGLISKNLKFKEKEQEKDDDWEDRGLLFAIPFALLVLLWFRKGWVVFSFVAMISMTSCSSDMSYKDLWLTKDYQAQQAFNRSDFTEAAILYSDPLHKGVSFYKSGEYGQAITEFSKDTTAKGAYNLGLAYFKSGDYTRASEAFGKAVELDAGMVDASKSREIVQLLIAEGCEPEEAVEAEEVTAANNQENKDMEDLGGGGQEATKEDMEKERKEETAETGKRKGKELDDVPEDFESGKSKTMDNIVMQKVDDDPALFMKRKFRYQLKKGMVAKPKNSDVKW